MLIHLIAAARPNFMKIAPLYHALKKEAWAKPVIVHTGQHYDLNMSEAFFQDLNLPAPHIHLGVGSGTHAEQTGRVMMAYEEVLIETQPDLVVVVGDVNSTMACTLAASKIVYPKISDKRRVTSDESPESRIQNPASSGCSPLPALRSALGLRPLPQEQRSSNDVLLKRSPPKSYEPLAMSYELMRRPLVAHLEAGLRSFDRTMPEEINRLVTDALADILWTPSPDADENLMREGVSPQKIHRVGNIMIDSLEMLKSSIESEAAYQELNLRRGEYGVVTLHRPSNVDSAENLAGLCRALGEMSNEISLVFPVHPRTRKSLEQFGLLPSLINGGGIRLLEPLSYIRFMNLVFNCRLAITDSGGIQEETSYLGIPCLTLRDNTERPITIARGTNQLCTVQDLQSKAAAILSRVAPELKRIDLWDGKTADRIVNSLRFQWL